MPTIYFTTPEGTDEGVRNTICSVCDKLGLDVCSASAQADAGAAAQILIENAAFVIADITCEDGNPVKVCQIAYEIGYAKRAQKTVFLITQSQDILQQFGQEDVLCYRLEDMKTFAGKLLAGLVGLCRKERIRYNHFPGMPELKEEAKLPIIAKESLQTENYVALGDAFVDNGQYEQAHQEYSRAILHAGHATLSPHHGYIFFKRAFVSKKLGFVEDALKDYTQAITVNPTYVDAYVARGLMLYELRKYQDALQDFQEASTLKPNFPRVYVFAGAMYRMIKDYEKALAQLNTAISLSPNYAEAYFNRGQVYSDMPDYEKAIEDFTHAVSLNPKYTEAFLKRGLVHKAIKNFDLAIQDFQHTIELDPKNADGYIYRGQTLYEKGYHEYHQLAIEDWRKAIDLGSPNAKELEELIRATVRKL